MASDNAGQVVYKEEEVVELLMQGHDVSDLLVENANALNQLISHLEVKDWGIYRDPGDVNTWDKENQQKWFIPKEFATLDVKDYVTKLCRNEKDLARVQMELAEYERRGLLPLLQWLAYLVSVLKENDIVFGVGRGSSAASQVLYLMGVHRLDAVKYELDFFEFMR